MVHSKLFIRKSKDIACREVESISRAVESSRTEEISRKAKEIVGSYLVINQLVNPVTLARSAFYIALKEYDEDPRGKIQSIKNNNGHPNKWWIHLFPTVEKLVEC